MSYSVMSSHGLFMEQSASALGHAAAVSVMAGALGCRAAACSIAASRLSSASKGIPTVEASGVPLPPTDSSQELPGALC